jgi:hypothetical protein
MESDNEPTDAGTGRDMAPSGPLRKSMKPKSQLRQNCNSPRTCDFAVILRVPRLSQPRQIRFLPFRNIERDLHQQRT